MQRTSIKVAILGSRVIHEVHDVTRPKVTAIVDRNGEGEDILVLFEVEVPKSLLQKIWRVLR
jgi:hypothetical protein